MESKDDVKITIAYTIIKKLPHLNLSSKDFGNNDNICY